MKQLFIIFIATCFIACTADEDESFKMSSYETSVVNEDGSLTILIPGDSASSVNAIKSITNSKLLRFKKCLYSFQTLNNIMTFLNKNKFWLQYKRT